MDRRTFLKAVPLAALASCVPKELILKIFEDKKYDTDDLLIKDLESLIDCSIKYDTSVKFKVEEEESERNAYGLGFRKGSKLITADHLITVDSVRANTPFGVMEFPAETLERHAYLPETK